MTVATAYEAWNAHQPSLEAARAQGGSELKFAEQVDQDLLLDVADAAVDLMENYTTDEPINDAVADIAHAFTCEEAETVICLFKELGDTESAVALLTKHIELDEPTDLHAPGQRLHRSES